MVVDPNAVGGGFQTLMGFQSDAGAVVPGGNPAPGVPAGTAVPVGAQKGGNGLLDHLRGDRVTTLPPGTTPDYTNALAKIHINNWTEVNELNFAEFVTGCCTPIDATLSVQFTVDHEEMDAGDWSLGITSCSPLRPGRHHPGRLRPRRDCHPPRRLRHDRRGHQHLDQLLLHRDPLHPARTHHRPDRPSGTGPTR